MSGALLLHVCIVFAAIFDVQDIPLENRNASCFFADVSGDKTADLIVLDGYQLRLFEDARADSEKRITLLPGTSAVDIADIEGDGISEVIAIRGEQVMLYRTSAAAQKAPQALFSIRTLFSDAGAQPFITVLVVRRDGAALLALPREDTFELRTLDGEVADAFPIGADAPRHVAYGRPFTRWTAHPPQIAPPNSLEWHISRVLAFKPTLPDDMLPLQTMDPIQRRTAPRQLPDASSVNPDAWPWFPVRKDRTRRERALYALTPGEQPDTVIRVQRAAPGAADTPDLELRMGPERIYPGIILTNEDDLPDFNGDGFVDMVLWKAPRPAPALDTLARAVMGGKWPVWITTHLYLPEHGRFSPAPSARIGLEAPLTWFMARAAGAPVQHVVMRDMVGDGRADFGCSVKPRTYSVWRHTETGFAEAPDFHHVFPESIMSVEARADLDGRGRTSIVLRSDRRIFVLLAVSPPQFPTMRDDAADTARGMEFSIMPPAPESLP